MSTDGHNMLAAFSTFSSRHAMNCLGSSVALVTDLGHNGPHSDHGAHARSATVATAELQQVWEYLCAGAARAPLLLLLCLLWQYHHKDVEDMG